METSNPAPLKLFDPIVSDARDIHLRSFKLLNIQVIRASKALVFVTYISIFIHRVKNGGKVKKS